MARPLDPERHRARRLQIIDAGLTVLSRMGYRDATTASICREAGIGSGTFFHYFPTKDSLVVAILREGTAETADFFDSRRERADAVQVLSEYAHHTIETLKDPRAAGFIAAIGGLGMHEEITSALGDDERVVHENLSSWVDRAREDGRARTDMPTQRIVEWLLVLLEGFSSRVSASTMFDVSTEGPELMRMFTAFLTDSPTGSSRR